MNYRILVFISILIIGIGACNQEMSTTNKETQNEIFWDFKFGMERQAFFDTCFSLNDYKIIQQGSKNTSVAYTDSTNFRNLVDINFYPQFNKADVISYMPVRYNYRAWAPWNKELHADSLLLEVVDLISKTDKIEFQEQKDRKGKSVFISRNGPKSIEAISEDDYYVRVGYKNEKFNDE